MPVEKALEIGAEPPAVDCGVDQVERRILPLATTGH